jgi:YggT family protein
MFSQLYLLIQYLVIAGILIIVALMAIRLLLNFIDPNPFGSAGKFSYWFKKQTDSLVIPAASWLGMMRIDARYAPFLTMLLACVAGYFTLQAVGAVTFTLDGVINSTQNGKFAALVGFLLYGFLALLSLAIIMRILLSWFFIVGNAFTRFLAQLTDPILLPFRRLIPPLGFIDISPMILLFLINFLQIAVAGTLISR